MVRLLLSNVDATSNQAQFLALEIHFVQLICTRVMVPKSRFYGLIESVIQVMSIASSQHSGGQYDRGAVFQKLRSDEKMPWGHPPRLRPWHRHCSREVFGYTVMGSLSTFWSPRSLPVPPLGYGPDVRITSGHFSHFSAKMTIYIYVYINTGPLSRLFLEVLLNSRFPCNLAPVGRL